jgi:alpha-beta hydrolase superfamily lysophospholipase
MTNPNPSTEHIIESTGVTLARMEGKLDGIDYKVGDLMTRMVKTESDVAGLKAQTQALSQNADAEEAKKIALALALKEAEETRRVSAESTWSPFAKLISAMAAATAVVAIGLQIYFSIHH